MSQAGQRGWQPQATWLVRLGHWLHTHSILIPAALANYALVLLLTLAPEWSPLGLIAATVLAVLAALLRAPRLVLTALLLALAAISVSVHAQPLLRLEAMQLVGSHRFTVQLTGAASPLASHFGFVAQTERSRAEARIDTIDGEPAPHASVTLIGPLGDSPAWGDRLELSGTLLPSEAGEARGFLLAVSEVDSVQPAGGVLASTEGLRERFRQAASSVPGVAGELLTGLAIGDTSRVSAELGQAMKTASLTHLMAVSGANCALIIGLMWGGCALLGASRRLRLIAALAALGGFVLLVTPQPSVLRAAVMATIALIALARGSLQQGLVMLAAAIIVLLWVEPWLAWNAGFALSVCATAGLLTLTRPIEARLRPKLGPLALAIAVPLAAQLACTPILVLLNPSIALWGVPANIIAGWFAPAATLLGVAACMLLPLIPWLGQLLVWLAAIPSAIVGHTALAVQSLPNPSLPWLPGMLGALLAAAVTAVLLLGWFTRNHAMRRATATALAFALAIGVGVWGVGPLIHSGSRPGNWVIAGCDVGQGDAFLIRDGDSVGLIDTGPKPERLSACLHTMGVQHLDLLVLTHYDQDHVGGVSAVVGKVDRVLVGPIGDASDERLRAELVRGGAQLREVQRGDTDLLGNTPIAVLWPTPGQEPGNGASVTVSMRLAGISALFLGDLGEEVQDALLRAGAPHGVQVVKVAHHGSADQSAKLYAQLHAAIGLIGVGENSYGHPTATLLNLLEQNGTLAARTDRQGLLLIAPATNGQLTLWTERDSGGT